MDLSLLEEQDECSAFSGGVDLQEEVPTEVSTEAVETEILGSVKSSTIGISGNEDSPAPLNRGVINPVRKKSRQEAHQEAQRVEDRQVEMSSFSQEVEESLQTELEEKQKEIDELKAENERLKKEKEEHLKEIRKRQEARRKAKEQQKEKAKEEEKEEEEVVIEPQEEEEEVVPKRKKKSNPVRVPTEPVFNHRSVDQVGTSNFVSFTTKLAINNKFKKYQKHFEKGHLLSTRDFDFLEDENGFVMVYRYKGTSQDIKIPSYVGESAVMYLHPNFLSSVLNPLNDSRFRGLKRSLQEVDTTSFTNTRFSNILTGAKSIQLPDKLQAIPPLVFSGCTRLRRIIVPETVGTISPDAFEGSKIKEIVLLGDCPANFQLVSLPTGCKVYCRVDCLASYETFVLQQNRRSSRVYKQLVRS